MDRKGHWKGNCFYKKTISGSFNFAIQTHFSLVIDELMEFKCESKSAKLLVEPLQLFEYLSRVTPRLVLKLITQMQ